MFACHLFEWLSGATAGERRDVQGYDAYRKQRYRGRRSITRTQKKSIQMLSISLYPPENPPSTTVNFTAGSWPLSKFGLTPFSLTLAPINHGLGSTDVNSALRWWCALLHRIISIPLSPSTRNGMLLSCPRRTATVP